MRTVPVVVVVSAAALGVGVAAAATPNGIRGTVFKSPITPVCTVDVPCSAPAAGFTLVFSRGGVRVATATTSGAGMYRVSLRPGTYVVDSLRRAIIGSLPPRTVRVRRGHFTVVNFELDTGIR